MTDRTKDLIEALHAMRDADDRRRRTEPGTSAHADAERELEWLVDRIFTMNGPGDPADSDASEDDNQRSA